MTLDPDILIDRRRLKRRLTLWRLLAIAAAFFAVVAGLSRDEDAASSFGLGGSYVARVTIGGIIGDSRDRHDLLKSLRDDKRVKAVIIAVDSPGGTTTGGEALYEDLRKLSEAKPVAAVFGTVAASAAYLAGIATDYIVARGNTITGSVGVIFQWAEFSDLLSKVGVKVEEIRSGPLKAKPSPFSPTDEASRQLSEALVKESQIWFVDLVTQRRKRAASILDDIKTGRIYTGRQAADAGLVDEIGDEDTAMKWFTESRGVDKNLKVIDRKPGRSISTTFLQSAVAGISAKIGIPEWLSSGVIASLDNGSSQHLDGLLSIWQAR